MCYSMRTGLPMVRVGSIVAMERFTRRLFTTPGIVIGALLWIVAAIVRTLERGDVLAALITFAALLALAHGVVSLVAGLFAERGSKRGARAWRPEPRRAGAEQTWEAKPTSTPDGPRSGTRGTGGSRGGGGSRRIRDLDRSASDARQGRSGDNYVDRVLTGFRRNRRYRVDRGVYLDAPVNGRKVGDVDWLIRDESTGACVSLEVKTSDPRQGSRHRCQAARAAEAVRVGSDGEWRPVPVVVYVDRDRRFHQWKSLPLQEHASGEIEAIDVVYSVGARNLKQALERLLTS